MVEQRTARRRHRGGAMVCSLAFGIFACLAGSFALAAEEPRPPKADEHTISLLHFDEMTGTVAKDASGKGNDVKFEEPPRDPEWYKHGRFGGCLLFDGKNADKDGDKQGDADGMIWPKGAKADPKGAGFTAEMWVRHAHLRGWQFYFTHSGGYYFIAKQDKLFVTVKPVKAKRWLELHSKPCLKTGVWQHVAFTYDDKALRIICDGLEVGRLDLPGKLAAGSDATIVGRDSDVRPSQIRGFCGLMDEMRISNIARTSFPKGPYTPEDPMPTPKE